MATTCSREHSIRITTPLPTPLAYYKLDSFAGLTVDDSVGSRDLTLALITTPPTIIPGKISNAFQSAGGVSQWRAVRTNADIDLGGVDFTVRIWFRMFAANGILFDTYSAVDPGEHYFELAFNNVGSDMKIDVTIVNGPGFFDSLTISTPLIPIEFTTWHHIIAWHRTGVEIGVRLDNGTPVTGAFTLGLDPLAELEYWSTGDLDELSIWRGQVLTTNEQNSDWNDGNGVTYPF